MRGLLLTIILFLAHHAHSQVHEYQIGNLSFAVALPINYDQTKQYPVVYSNDGEWLFGNGSWRLEEKVNAWIQMDLIDPVILVGIYSQGQRERYYLPYRDPTIGNYIPGATKYTERIIRDIIPFVEKNYSTSDKRAIMGASFGGLHSTWAGIHYPETFQFVIAQSPSYWVNDFQIHDDQFEPSNLTIWIDIGTKDWDDVLTMYYTLSQKGFTAGENLFYYEDFNGTHTGTSWCGRLLYPLILFTKGNETEVTSFDLHAEYIPSMQRTDNFYYSRINPVVTLSNGIKFTPFPYVKFDSMAGHLKVSTYGSLQVEKRKTDSVFARYRGNKAFIKVRWRDNPMNQ